VTGDQVTLDKVTRGPNDRDKVTGGQSDRGTKCKDTIVLLFDPYFKAFILWNNEAVVYYCVSLTCSIRVGPWPQDAGTPSNSTWCTFSGHPSKY
jgi:hypothetical protein